MTNVIYFKVLIVLAGYIILLTTSGLLVKFILSRVKHEKGIKGAIATQEELDVGFIIGKCENILVLSFVLFDAYTALALIFAAKTIIRQNDIKNNSLYFLAGTMVNVTYSIVIGIIIKGLIGIP